MAETKKKQSPAGGKKTTVKKTEEKSRMSLTDKQEQFVLELLACDNQRQAYRAAYDCKSMSDRSVDCEASKLMKNPKVSQRYERLKEAARKRNEIRAVTRAARVLEELEAIGFGEKEYESYDMTGEEYMRKPAMGARLKALELLGKSEKLFTDKIGLDEESSNVDVTIRVIRNGT